MTTLLIGEGNEFQILDKAINFGDSALTARQLVGSGAAELTCLTNCALPGYSKQQRLEGL